MNESSCALPRAWRCPETHVSVLGHLLPAGHGTRAPGRTVPPPAGLYAIVIALGARLAIEALQDDEIARVY
ncbi:hypothetical protein [Pseudomonas fulva]|uniref:hypothetical protein n=1 Tax=Pseudomonas fulva TaxID=47880 RepID=UPI003F909450